MKILITFLFLFSLISVGFAQDMDISDIYVPLPVQPPSTQGCGYKIVVDVPTQGGTEYITFTGINSAGEPYEITAQQYIYGDAGKKQKASILKDAINDSSSRNGNPIIASAAQNTIVIQPCDGHTIDSVSWKNGTNEQANMTEEMEPATPPNKTTVGMKIHGQTCGYDNSMNPSVISVGIDNISVEISIENKSSYQIIKELQQGLKTLNTNSKIGIDQNGDLWLLWSGKKSQHGNTDIGIEQTFVSDGCSYSQGVYTYIGKYVVLTLGVDIDEALPHYGVQ